MWLIVEQHKGTIFGGAAIMCFISHLFVLVKQIVRGSVGILSSVTVEKQGDCCNRTIN